MSRWPEIRELTRLRTLSFLRQKEIIFWVFVFPMVLAAVLGFAFKSGKPVPSIVGVLEAHADVDLVARLDAEEQVRVERFADVDAAHLALRSGKIDTLIVDPTQSPPKLRLDPVRAEAELARLRVLVAVGGVEADRIELERVEERGSRYVDFLYPGLLGMNLMGTGLWAIGFAIVELRQRKVLKRLLVTPMRRSSLLLSFLLSRLVFLALELGALTAFGVWVLDVPLRGSLFEFFLLSFLGAVSFSGLGILAGSRVKTIEGVSGLVNLIMMPMWLGSGIFFSYERFPEFVQPVLKALPLTALNDALRKLMIEGQGLLDMPLELGLLVVWMVIPFAAALKIFRWT